MPAVAQNSCVWSAQTVALDGVTEQVGYGLTVTAKLVEVPVQALALAGVTVTLPLAEPKFTVMDMLPWPEATDAPLGTVQVQVVAPLTAEIEYPTPVCPAQTADGPEIGPAAPTE